MRTFVVGRDQERREGGAKFPARGGGGIVLARLGARPLLDDGEVVGSPDLLEDGERERPLVLERVPVARQQAARGIGPGRLDFDVGDRVRRLRRRRGRGRRGLRRGLGRQHAGCTGCTHKDLTTVDHASSR